MAPLAFISNLDFTEILVIVAGAVIVFGKDLPQVVMRGLQTIAKLRRAVRDMWEETGLEQEMRKVRVELDRETKGLPNPKALLQDGKQALTGPVQTWRDNLMKEVQDVVPVEVKTAPGATPPLPPADPTESGAATSDAPAEKPPEPPADAKRDDPGV
ncbi:MAG: hypothetical protein R3F17_04860 [Planctomycetota bacterium]